MYINKILPFLKDSDFVGSKVERIEISSIYCPVNFGKKNEVTGTKQHRDFKAYYVLPLEIYVLDEEFSTLKKIMHDGIYGEMINVKTIIVDYMSIAKRINVEGNVASIQMNGAFLKEDDIATASLVNAAANGVGFVKELVQDVVIEPKNLVNFNSWLDTETVSEAVDSSILAQRKAAQNQHKGNDLNVIGDSEDTIYSILDSYFALPEGEDIKNGGREVVPLLVGPTGVFKSATVKELCKKYDYRLVDFRVSFTSRLDYSGLFKMQELDGEMYSYACPMEELVTCSDGFREYCHKAYDKITQILNDGYIIANKSSNGEVAEGDKKYLTQEQIDELNKIQAQYREYMKTPVLFFDEITRTTDGGVEGILVELLNQKRFNNMTLNGCKFVAATNLNLKTGNMRHDDMMYALDQMYQVNNDLDVAYSNRFLPLKVLPKDVEGRWYAWADGTKKRNGVDVKNIHPIVIDFLKTPEAVVGGESLVYNDTPVLDAIDDGKSDEERKAQTFPNYRTWEMCSDYMYAIDDDYEERKKIADSEGVVKNKEVYREFRDTIINGLISSWAGEKFIKFLVSKGYKSYVEMNGDPTDDVGDFLSSTLGAGVPALMIGPSSLGKTSRVKAYMKSVEKKTGLKPVLIDVNLASMDTVDIMGMPTKKPLVEYVAGKGLSKLGLGSLGKELGGIIEDVRKDNPEMGLVDTLTLRAPDMTKKELFKKALDEGREVILFFDECNRVKNPTIMSAMFECISDQRIFGISFKEQKDKVKIVAACNMAHNDLGANLEWGEEVGSYTNAGSIDPALAARFSIYWKKNYDEKDVKSFVSFLQGAVDDGDVDGLILEYFESLSTEEAIKVMASVEKRKLENAESSTRALFQLSKDIRSMRGQKGANGFKKSLFNGRVIFNKALVEQFDNFKSDTLDTMIDLTTVANRALDLSAKITKSGKDWEPLLLNSQVIINGETLTAQDVIDTLEALNTELSDYIKRPITSVEEPEIRTDIDMIKTFVGACSRLDKKVSDKRKDIFTSYVGEGFTQGFLTFFNDNFGTANDVVITIEMLDNSDLIEPFVNRLYSKISTKTTDDQVAEMLKLIKDFDDTFHATLPARNYADLILSIKNVLNGDSMSELINRSGADQDEVFTKAEEMGDAWILEVLRGYPAGFTKDDIDEMRNLISNNGNASARSNISRKSRIL